MCMFNSKSHSAYFVPHSISGISNRKDLPLKLKKRDAYKIYIIVHNPEKNLNTVLECHTYQIYKTKLHWNYTQKS